MGNGNSARQIGFDSTGGTIICRWKDDKTAAFSISADDSLHSQLDFMIPEMLKRGFAGTFFINPGLGVAGEKGSCWISRKAEWLDAAKRGCDFGNHTIHHKGAQNFEEAEYEIGESARNIWASNPGQKLQLFLSGGGTTWNAARDDVERLLAKYCCVRGRGGGTGTEDLPCHDEEGRSATVEELKGFVDKAIMEGSWHFIGCHGVGPEAEWLPTDAESFTALLDYLVEKKEIVWVGTNTQVHKYDRERSSAKIKLLKADDSMIRLTLSSGQDSKLYDLPLTLKTLVPAGWTHCLVEQKGAKKVQPVLGGIVLYEAVPDSREIILAGKA